MKAIKQGIVAASVLLLTTAAHSFDISGLEPLSPSAVPRAGTFWLMKGPIGSPMPPYPCLPTNLDAPVYALGDGQFLVDDSEVDYQANNQQMSSVSFPPGP